MEFRNKLEGPNFLKDRMLFVGFDNPTKNQKKGMFFVESFEKAEKINLTEKASVFLTVNKIKSPVRRVENLEKILSWVIEFDKGSKEEQMDNIKKLGIEPSTINESKRGYHVYFDAKNASIKNYTRICKALSATSNADLEGINPVRLLRMPFTMHYKDLNDPFLVKMVYGANTCFDENFMIRHFCEPFEKVLKAKNKIDDRFDSFFESTKSINLLDKPWAGLQALGLYECFKRISGSRFVHGQNYTFKKQTNGNLNIFIDDKPTSCFIDKNNQYWSKTSGGGGGIFQWLKFVDYGHDNFQVISILKQIFPECF